MKKTILLIALALGALTARAQQADSAAGIVDQYLRVLNHDALPVDSTLYIESRIFTLGYADTLLLLRWHQAPNLDRVELYRDGQLSYGIISSGSGVYHIYNTSRQKWHLTDRETFLSHFTAYDFRGPLYHHEVNGLEISEPEPVSFRGQECLRVKVFDPQRRNRFYYFERQSRLLFFIEELDIARQAANEDMPEVQWRAVQEYIRLKGSTMVSEESYQDPDGITIIRHRYSFLPKDKKLFEK